MSQPTLPLFESGNPALAEECSALFGEGTPERDIEGAYSNALPAGYEPVEIIVRHPDFENETYYFGMNHRVIELDLGSSFDITRIGPSDAGVVNDWIDGVLNEIKDLPEDHPARATVLEQIELVKEALS